MQSFDRFLAATGFLFVGLAVLVSPWLFGAWEMWWFWPFVVLIAIATGTLALRMMIGALTGTQGITIRTWPRPRLNRTALILSTLPFLGYAFIRMLQADVPVDAERSFLLFLTPLLLGIHVLYGLRKEQRKWLFDLLLLNLCMLGLYGIINHEITGSHKVLWAPGFPGYVSAGRASGSFFCPDHYAGAQEFALGAAMAMLLTRRTPWRGKLAGGLLAVIALWGIVLSKSRGSGLTVLVMLGAALIWGFWQWRARLRWVLRVAMLSLSIVTILAVSFLATSYTERFLEFFGGAKLRETPWREAPQVIWRHVENYSRPQMYAAALRAWRTDPVFGIGPGMHQNLWPHFAASPDGDKAREIWPRHRNNAFHSYEVHSDWLQLLEEYGVVGLLLFVIPAAMAFIILRRALRASARETMSATGGVDDVTRHVVIMTALFAVAAMTFHSLGDFNLQIPANNWMLATILALGVACCPLRREPSDATRGKPGKGSV